MPEARSRVPDTMARSAELLGLALLLAILPARAGAQPLPYSWQPVPPATGHRLVDRIPPPAGYQRPPLPPGSFGDWLRGLPLLPGRPLVLLYDGSPKGRQDVHEAVLDLDVGQRDLQQCADLVIRLRAEYLWAAGRAAAIAFQFTSGDVAAWRQWQDGVRPVVQGGTKVTWSRTARRDGSYASFRRYLDRVFTYAGSRSLARELTTVADARRLRVGDVVVQGGSPGHAVLLIDVAQRPGPDGEPERLWLLAQSYMPAQQPHVLRNLADPAQSPWFRIDLPASPLVTPEWTFRGAPLRTWPDVAPATPAPPR